MTQLGINEKFLLCFLISKNEVELYDKVLRKFTAVHSITQYPKAPAMSQVVTEVKNIHAAVALMSNINTSLAMIGHTKENWDMGLLTKDEYSGKLSEYMTL